jgi:hypothetical protein
MSNIHTITSSVAVKTTEKSKPTIIRRTSSIDADGNVVRRRRAGVYGVPASILERKYSSVKNSTSQARAAIRRPGDLSLHRSNRWIVKIALSAYVVMLAILVLSLNCPGLAHARSISEAQCRGSHILMPPHVFYQKAAEAIRKDEQKMKVEAVEAQVKAAAPPNDDDAGLAKAFDTDFTCSQVVSEDATQCDIAADNGRTVSYFCPVSCDDTKSTVTVVNDVPNTPKEIADGSYHGYETSFDQCAAVGSVDARSDACSGDSRGEGCACQSSSQCAAISGSRCCYQGFCSYEHLAPLDPCMM